MLEFLIVFGVCVIVVLISIMRGQDKGKRIRKLKRRVQDDIDYRDSHMKRTRCPDRYDFWAEGIPYQKSHNDEDDK